MKSLPDGDEARQGARDVPVVAVNEFWRRVHPMEFSTGNAVPVNFELREEHENHRAWRGLVIWLRSFERHVGKMKKRAIEQSERSVRQTAFAERPR